MNRKITGILSVLALSAFTFAQEGAAAPAAHVETAPVAAEVPAAETSAPAAAVEAAPAEAAPVAVRGAETAPAAAQPVEEPAVVVAPKAVRGAGNDTGPSSEAAARFREARNTVYYETVYTGEDGVPVRTVYVTQREGKDTVSLDELKGLYPMKFKVGARASVGAYQLSGDEWDGDHYDGMSWKAGIMSLIPLNAYTMGVKVGILYEQAKASESYYVNEVPTNFEFSQKKLDIPVLFTFKAANSRFFFDIGVDMAIPLYDKLKISYTDKNDKKNSSRVDLMDDYRNPMDWSFMFGFSIMANQYISLDIDANLGMNDLYNGSLKYMNMNLGASSLNVGLTVYPF